MKASFLAKNLFFAVAAVGGILEEYAVKRWFIAESYAISRPWITFAAAGFGGDEQRCAASLATKPQYAEAKGNRELCLFPLAELWDFAAR